MKSEDFTVLEVLNALLRQWRLVIALPVLVALMIGVWTFAQDRMYKATASFLPQGAESRGGGAAALAQQFGITVGSGGSGQSPQLYVDLLRSPAVLREAVESDYEFTIEGSGQAGGTLIDFWQIDPSTLQVPAWRKGVELLRERTAASLALETGIVRLTVSMTDPDLAEQVAVRLLEILNAFNTNVRQDRAEEEVRFIGGRAAEAERELRVAEERLQDFLRKNREFRNSPELLFEHDRLQRQVGMRQEVYTSLLRSEEQARVDAVRDTPLFTVIDPPTGTAEPVGRGTLVRAVLGFVFGLAIAVFVVLVREFMRRGRAAGVPEYREFQALRSEAWRDIRSPRTWFGRGGH